MDKFDTIRPRRKRHAGLGERIGIAVEADETCGARFAEGARMAAESNGAVHEHTARRRLQVPQRLVGHHRDVADQMPNSASARASSSVYASR